jgi:hypothetical protein
MNLLVSHQPRENLEAVEKPIFYNYLIAYANWTHDVVQKPIVLTAPNTELTVGPLVVYYEFLNKFTPYIDKLAFVPVLEAPKPKAFNPTTVMTGRNSRAFGGSPPRESVRSYPYVVLPQLNSRFNYVANEPESEFSPEVQLQGLIQSPVPLFNEDEILNFRGDPDDDGFVPCSKVTVDRAKEFLKAYASAGAETFFVPKVYPGPLGSIDIHWKNKKGNCLLTFPPTRKSQPRFTGKITAMLLSKGRLMSAK